MEYFAPPNTTMSGSEWDDEQAVNLVHSICRLDDVQKTNLKIETRMGIVKYINLEIIIMYFINTKGRVKVYV